MCSQHMEDLFQSSLWKLFQWILHRHRREKHNLILFQSREQVDLPWKLNDMFYSDLDYYTVYSAQVHSHPQCKEKRCWALSRYGSAWFQIMRNWQRGGIVCLFICLFFRAILWKKYASCTWGRWKGAIKVSDAWEQTRFSSDSLRVNCLNVKSTLWFSSSHILPRV